MVARGDLGAELPVEDVPYWQAKIVQVRPAARTAARRAARGAARTRAQAGAAAACAAPLACAARASYSLA